VSEKNKLIECPDCESKVSAKVIAARSYSSDDYEPFEILFLECPVCERTMIGHAELIQTDFQEWEFSQPTRLWPEPKGHLDRNIPTLVRNSIEEARACFRAKAFSACAVMCGRALEAVCKAHKTKGWQLAKGLKELKAKSIIDGRLFEWGEALRKHRNIGAHVNDEEITREDASDLLDFTTAICDYVYVLSAKYEEFKLRQAKTKSPSTSSASKPF
jgi:hypothetical protein